MSLRVVPDGMPTALAQKLTTMGTQVTFQFNDRDHRPLTSVADRQSLEGSCSQLESTAGLPWMSMAHLELTAIYEPVEEGWIQARIEQLPGVITVAPTAEEAREMLADALVEFLASFGGDNPPDAAGARRETLDLSVT